MAAADNVPPPQHRLSDPSIPASDLILRETQCLYSFILLVAFLSCIAWYSVCNAKKQESIVQSIVKGPGGKPLPVTKKTKDDGERKLGPQFSPATKTFFRYLAAVIFISYVATSTFIFNHAFYHDNAYKWSKDGLSWAGEWTVVHVIGSTFFYLYIIFSLFDWKEGPSVAHLFIWVLGLVGEVIFFSTTFTTAAACRLTNSRSQTGDNDCFDRWIKLDLVLYFVRILHLIALIGVFSFAWFGKVRAKRPEKLEDGFAHEHTPLLSGHQRSYDSQSGDVNTAGPNGRESYCRRPRSRTMSNAANYSAPSSRKDEHTAFYRPQKLPHKTWWEYVRGYSLFFPYLWPKDSVMLQLQVLVCFILVIIQRIVNIIVPNQIGEVVKQLNHAIKEVQDGQPLTMELFPLRASLFLGLLWILQGMLGPLRSLLWIPISQYSYRGLTTAAFNHVHSLSLDFHLSKRTGEVLSALNKGSSINSFLEQVTFQVIPMLFDLILSISVFYYKFGPLYAQINLVDSCWYLYMTIKMASIQQCSRRASGIKPQSVRFEFGRMRQFWEDMNRTPPASLNSMPVNLSARLLTYCGCTFT
ncbi:heavy metal tolerance protein precursor [Cordyceps fumosorosea ARSEF 2679]|uniref:Heavy metal tolerance protein n=1 Tax=Cordyceps fumosorosea (strain ARSEF 2679) TaxID=1081104 RepID=A0A167D7Z3_CORFA|nr:heavy metal tolerance protein precursor [Cordyceps fumosorosea ARSEF 2679]OAA42054.1 heavy metal tolerance protein precursor [Cordyceps fumosorosea ARSEF 2679]